MQDAINVEVGEGAGELVIFHNLFFNPTVVDKGKEKPFKEELLMLHTETGRAVPYLVKMVLRHLPC
jgi:hypothetical protein